MSTTVFSAHPAIAAEQLQQAELEAACGSGGSGSGTNGRRHSCNSGKYATRTKTPHSKFTSSRSCSISAKSTTGATTTGSGSATATATTSSTNSNKSATELVANDATINNNSNNTNAELLISTAQEQQCKSAKETQKQKKNTQPHSDVASQNNKTIPERTNYASVDDDDDDDEDEVDDEDEDDVDIDVVGGIDAADVGITAAVDVDDVDVDVNVDVGVGGIVRQTKDCINKSTALKKVPAIESVDETDHVLQRFSRKSSQRLTSATATGTGATPTTPTKTTNHRQYITETLDQCPGPISDAGGDGCGSGGCLSGVSSVISSPSASTVSSPLSTPTRLAPLQQLQHGRHYCCQKSAEFTSMQNRQHHNFHYHHHHNQHQHQQPHQHQHHHFKKSECALSDTNSACKKKLDPRLSPSPYRQLLPIALCILSFAAVFATLIVYMDTTEIRHQQFRLNMSRDYELNSVAQDDPALIAFLRQIHMRKYPMHFLKNRDAANEAIIAAAPSPPSVPPPSPALVPLATTVDRQQLLNMSSALNGDNLAPSMAHYVADLFGGKLNGAVIQSLTGPMARLITAPWLSENLHWNGVLVEPEPRWYFTLRKQNAQQQRMQIVHACVSPNPYPKEITIHNEDVRINSLHDEETSWFNSRVKCFPLYTIMLACDRVKYDLLSLGVQGHELDILQTLPFDKVQIDVISIHLLEDDHERDHNELRGYVQRITKFLAGKSYKLQGKFGQNFFYQHYSMTRNRNKDTLTLKTP